jgi:two-component system, chemotaxis family, chemotaxis protein CheY
VGFRVLLADDDSFMRSLISLALFTRGVTEIVEAKDGTEAQCLIAKDRFDFLILDWNMPGTSGLELVRDIRRSGASVPIMMITGEASRDKVRQAIEAGVSDYLVKPFDMPVLRQKIVKYCPESGPAGTGQCGLAAQTISSECPSESR